MLKAKDLRDQSIEELEATVIETKNELFEIKNEMKQAKKLEKPHLLREKKKDIAKLKTIICEKAKATYDEQPADL
ncbi:MAG: 50S ribosomal protein L29 [Chlamydiae bacterium]|nr:50S ribosomal protein L29 [Chlamydiota bacterium]